MQLKNLSVSLFFFVSVVPCHAQLPVRWNFNAERVTQTEWLIRISATLRPGWHIYSQYLNEGGPIPTTIDLNESEDYIPIGKAFEQGKPVQFYDSIYERAITWYTDQVTFIQKIKLNQPVSTLYGTIDYMTCNEHLCIPHREEFTIIIQSEKN